MRIRKVNAESNEVVAPHQVLAIGDGIDVAEVPAQLTLGALQPIFRFRALAAGEMPLTGGGLGMVFFLLSFQFRSYTEPIIVLAAIPFALIGVIWGNLLMGTLFSLPGLLGFCALGGAVVNDSILLVEFIKRERLAGRSVAAAARRASRHRFRAILLSSVTTMVGLVPLLFEPSRQAQVLIPVAISIVFGIFASTVLVLLVIPATYAIFGDLGWVEVLDGDPAGGRGEPAEAA